MKNFNFKVILTSLILVVTVTACTDHFSSLNTPPTSVTSIDPGFVFTEVIRDDNLNYNYEWIEARVFGGWAQQWGANDPNNGIPQYFQPHRRNDNEFWELKYTTVLKNLDRTKSLIIEDTEESDPEARSKLAMVRLYEVMTYETLTAVLGDIPFTEAVRGLEDITNPVYDHQSEIYSELLNRINSNVSQLTEGDATFGEADIIYQGDIENWRRFGNSLKLRTAMRMRYADPVAAEAAVTEAMSAPLISSHNESAMVATMAGGGSDENAHPILEELREPGDKSRIGHHLIEMLKENNDPRLEFIAEPTEASKSTFEETGNPDDLDYQGIAANLTNADYNDMNLSELSFPALDIWGNEDLAVPVHVLTYPEVLFLQAEAALLGWGGNQADAQIYFEQGIRAAMTMPPYTNAGFNGATISQEDIDNYVDSRTPLPADFETALEQISEERYVALFSRGSQAYLEWRRTGYPLLNPGTRTDNLTNGNIPRKAFYHESEQSLNRTNLQEAVDRQGGEDGYNAEIWIDQNTNNGQLFTN